MAIDLSGLEAEVTNNDTVDGSAIALINGVAQQIEDAIAADDIADATNVNALAARLRASSDALAAAIAANTPAEPPTP